MRRRLFGLATALTLLAVIGIVVLNGPAQAAPGDPGTNFYAYLSGNNETPATMSNTTGMATFHVNEDGTLSYTLTVYNILNPFMGHIHLGPPGVAGPVVVDLIPMGAPNSGPQNITTSGTITAANLSGPLKGQPLSALIKQLAYNAYVNIHTSNGTMTPGPGNYPGGEIRGNIISADANRIGTQPAVPAMVKVPTGVVTFPYPPTYAPPVVPVSAVGAPGIGSTSAGSAPNAPSGQAASNPAISGGSTSGAASGAPTTGGSGSTTSNPTGGGAGSGGTGAASGPLGAGTTITSGGTTGATSGSTTSSSSGSGTGGAGTVARP